MLAKSFLVSALVVFISIAAEINVFGARGVDLPPEEFLARGAWVLLGEVVEFQVLKQEWNFEYGNVVIRVDEVLEGKVNAALVNFPYQRQLGPVIENGYGWDLVAHPEVGKKLIMFFTGQDGTYSLSLLGANPVQEVSSFDDPKIIKLREAVRLHHLPR